MKANEGMTDRMVRLVIAIVTIVGSYFWLLGTLQIIAYVIGILALITSITGFCGLYSLFNISTCKIKSVKE